MAKNISVAEPSCLKCFLYNTLKKTEPGPWFVLPKMSAPSPGVHFKALQQTTDTLITDFVAFKDVLHCILG